MFSEIPRAWLDGQGQGHCPYIHTSEGHIIVDAHQLLPWWDHEVVLTDMATIYKK